MHTTVLGQTVSSARCVKVDQIVYLGDRGYRTT
jgi:hypothetical protein